MSTPSSPCSRCCRLHAALGKEVVEQYYDEESAKILQPVLEFLKGRGVEAQSIAKVGPIADTIIHAAQDGKFDLIAMGTHGHGALGRLVMGSAACAGGLHHSRAADSLIFIAACACLHTYQA
jgi:hypothetical protein